MEALNCPLIWTACGSQRWQRPTALLPRTSDFSFIREKNFPSRIESPFQCVSWSDEGTFWPHAYIWCTSITFTSTHCGKNANDSRSSYRSLNETDKNWPCIPLLPTTSKSLRVIICVEPEPNNILQETAGLQSLCNQHKYWPFNWAWRNPHYTSCDENVNA